MKVSLESNYKYWYTISDLEKAKAVIKYEKEYDESKPEDWARYAVEEALKGTSDYLKQILYAKAETCRNGRVNNAYGDDTGNADVWIIAMARTENGFIEVHACLSDIWQTGPDYSYKDHMYIVYRDCDNTGLTSRGL